MESPAVSVVLAWIAGRSVGTIRKKYCLESACENIDVHPDRPVTNVVFVEGHALGVSGIVTPRHLPKSGEAGGNPRVQIVAGRIACDLRVNDRPWPLAYISLSELRSFKIKL